MSIKTSFFLFVLLLITFPLANANEVTFSANLIPQDETIIEEEVTLDNNTNLDVSANVNPTPTETKTVGGQEVVLAKEYKFITNQGGDVIIQNTALPSIDVAIPTNTLVQADDTWDGIITPPKSVTTIPIEVSGFITPTSSITVGSPNTILIFDTAVTLNLNGVTGQIAYKIPGGTTWILISGCTGTYENPNDPPTNGECSISNGIDTKILTFHFTEFTGLSSTPTSTPSTPSTGSSGGHGNTGVGSPRIFGSSGGSSGGGYIPGDTQKSIFPSWFDNVSDWYREGKISAIEFLKAYQWLIENVL